MILLRPNRFALGVLSFASAKESTKEKQPGGPFLLKGPPRLLQRAGAFSLTRENAWTHNVTFEDPPTRACAHGGSSPRFRVPSFPVLGYFLLLNGGAWHTIQGADRQT